MKSYSIRGRSCSRPRCRNTHSQKWLGLKEPFRSFFYQQLESRFLGRSLCMHRGKYRTPKEVGNICSIQVHRYTCPMADTGPVEI